MPFGYTITGPVESGATSMHCLYRACGLPRRVLHESGGHGEREAGATTTAFAVHSLAAMHVAQGRVRAVESSHPFGMQVVAVTTVLGLCTGAQA